MSFLSSRQPMPEGLPAVPQSVAPAEDALTDFGFRATKDRVHINDLHATILKLLGLDHEKLTFLFQGRQMRLTDVGGQDDIAAQLLA